MIYPVGILAFWLTILHNAFITEAVPVTEIERNIPQGEMDWFLSESSQNKAFDSRDVAGDFSEPSLPWLFSQGTDLQRLVNDFQRQDSAPVQSPAPEITRLAFSPSSGEMAVMPPRLSYTSYPPADPYGVTYPIYTPYQPQSLPPPKSPDQVLREKFMQNFVFVNDFLVRYEAAEQAAIAAAATSTTSTTTTTTTTPRPSTTTTPAPTTSNILHDSITNLWYIPRQDGNNLVVEETSGQSIDVNGYPVFLDLSASIAYVTLRDGRVLRSVVIDHTTLAPRFIQSNKPLLFDTHTGVTYLQDESKDPASLLAYQVVDKVSAKPIKYNENQVYVDVTTTSSYIYYFSPNKPDRIDLSASEIGLQHRLQ